MMSLHERPFQPHGPAGGPVGEDFAHTVDVQVLPSPVKPVGHGLHVKPVPGEGTSQHFDHFEHLFGPAQPSVSTQLFTPPPVLAIKIMCMRVILCVREISSKPLPHFAGMTMCTNVGGVKIATVSIAVDITAFLVNPPSRATLLIALMTFWMCPAFKLTTLSRVLVQSPLIPWPATHDSCAQSEYHDISLTPSDSTLCIHEARWQMNIRRTAVC